MQNIFPEKNTLMRYERSGGVAWLLFYSAQSKRYTFFFYHATFTL